MRGRPGWTPLHVSADRVDQRRRGHVLQHSHDEDRCGECHFSSRSANSAAKTSSGPWDHLSRTMVSTPCPQSPQLMHPVDPVLGMQLSSAEPMDSS